MDLQEIQKLIEDGKADLIGESEWVKDAAYQVYKLNDKFYSIIVYDRQCSWVLEDSIEEITEEQANNLIE